MYKKLAKDVKAIDEQLRSLLQQITSTSKLDPSVKNLWVKVNRLHTTRLETLRLMRIGYSHLNNRPSLSDLENLPISIVRQYATAKGLEIPLMVPIINCKTFKDIVNLTKE